MDFPDYSEDIYLRPPEKEEVVLTPQDFSSAVRDNLSSQEIRGYSLGEPLLFDGAVWLQVCILDPQEEIPSKILLFTQDRHLFPLMREVLQAKDQEFGYHYDSQSDSYYFDLVDNKVLRGYGEGRSLVGNFDRKGKIENVVLEKS